MLVNHFVGTQDVLYDVKQGILENYGWENSEVGPFSIKGYLKYIMKDTTWGDSITLCLLASMWGVRITIVDSKNFNETRIRHDRDLSKDIDFILLFNGIEEKGHYSSIRRSDRVLNEAKMLKRTAGYDVEKDCRERIMRNDAEWDKVVERANWSIVSNEKLASYKSKGKVISKIEKIIAKRKVQGDSGETEEGEKAPTPVKQVEPDIQEVNIGDKRCVKCCIDFDNTAK